MGKKRNTIPASKYSADAGMSRERVVRLIQSGEIAGYCDEDTGRWYVYADALARAKGE